MHLTCAVTLTCQLVHKYLEHYLSMCSSREVQKYLCIFIIDFSVTFPHIHKSEQKMSQIESFEMGYSTCKSAPQLIIGFNICTYSLLAGHR
uniref:Pco133868b n=1 Tax=Arundo donax TaxID=35708 RepID=A0A0A9CFH1_ARUDO